MFRPREDIAFMTTATAHEALAFDCPFCKALAGEPCRTRNSGREQTWPHSRRIARSTPPDERFQPTYVDALCCVCGNKRQISPDYHRYNDCLLYTSPSPRDRS